MTALREYALLEASGWYAETPDAAADEVLVTFGDATLTIQRFDETPLAHWPLASLATVDGPRALTLAPDADAPERLGLDDRAMIDAIRRVAAGAPAGPRRRPRKGFGRLIAAACAAGVAAGLWLGAPAVLGGLAAATPPAVRAAIGAAAVRAYGGPDACRPEPAARRARARLEASLSRAAGAPVRLAFLRDAPVGAAPAPGPGGWLAAPPPQGEVAAFTAGAARALARAEASPPLTLLAQSLGYGGLARAALSGAPLDALGLAAARAMRAPGPEPDPARAAALAAAAGPVSPEDWRALRRACGVRRSP